MAVSEEKIRELPRFRADFPGALFVVPGKAGIAFHATENPGTIFQDRQSSPENSHSLLEFFDRAWEGATVDADKDYIYQKNGGGIHFHKYYI